MHFAIAGLWFALLSIAAERGFWWLVGTNPGSEWGVMVAVWSFIVGGIIGRHLLTPSKPTMRRVVGVGVAVPACALLASGTAFCVLGAVSNLLRGKWTDGAMQLLFSPLLGVVVGGSGLLVTFWLILPMGVLGSWVLSCLGRLRNFEERV